MTGSDSGRMIRNRRISGSPVFLQRIEQNGFPGISGGRNVSAVFPLLFHIPGGGFTE